MRPIDWIVVHTSATADKAGQPVDASAESIRRYHVDHNGWQDIGYHFVVRRNGAVEKGRPLDQVGAHVGGFNERSVGICCSGHGDLADFTLEQHQVLATICADLIIRLGLDATRVIGHREADDHGAPHVDKTCPGTKVDMDRVRAEVQAVLAQPAAIIAMFDRRISALEARLGPA